MTNNTATREQINRALDRVSPRCYWFKPYYLWPADTTTYNRVWQWREACIRLELALAKLSANPLPQQQPYNT